MGNHTPLPMKHGWWFVMPNHLGSSTSDRERPLADRGVKDAILVSQELNKHNLHINQVRQPAKRFDTALIMVSELGLSTENIQIEEELYDFIKQLWVCSHSSQWSPSIMTFGHNNACTQLAQSLGNYTNSNIPTATAVFFILTYFMVDIQQRTALHSSKNTSLNVTKRFVNREISWLDFNACCKKRKMWMFHWLNVCALLAFFRIISMSFTKCAMRRSSELPAWRSQKQSVLRPTCRILLKEITNKTIALKRKAWTP